MSNHKITARRCLECGRKLAKGTGRVSLQMWRFEGSGSRESLVSRRVRLCAGCAEIESRPLKPVG